MSGLVEEVELFNTETGQYQPALMYDGIDVQHLVAVEETWMPILTKELAIVRERHKFGTRHFDRAGYRGELAARDLEDAHWDWRKKHAAYGGDPQYRPFLIECEQNIQGLMYVDFGQRCRISAQSNQHLVYVKFIATAPWNRPGLTQHPRYRGVGTNLIVVAIQLSIEEEFRGRIGLHALPQAEKFYRNSCGMTDLGQDVHESNLVYFEMTPEQAQAYLNG